MRTHGGTGGTGADIQFEVQGGSLLTHGVLDSILALQLTVAWAGEGACDPPRLGWWATDLVDEAGGGDLLLRLLPKTHAWAGLEAAREAARREDERARRTQASPDDLRTLFFLGVEVDERLAERLADLKRLGRPPSEALPLPVVIGGVFSKDGLAAALATPGVKSRVQVVPGARQVLGARPEAPDLVARNLAAALLPLSESYPLPFYRLERS